MADDVREYVRAAQAAEVQGDKPHAVELLRKAATLYRNQGNHPRALQMLRHARRLDGKSAELADELSRLEWLPDQSLARAAGADEPEKAVAMLDELERPKELIERGPTKADPSLQAWCSFCCRPRGEVGDLVAGPAGAFICAACLRESSQLLGMPALEAPVAPASEPPKEAVKSLPFVGQQEAASTVDAALKRGVRTVLVVGPAGSGKSTYLAELARRGEGVQAPDRAAIQGAPADARLLVDLDSAADAEALLGALGDRPVLAVIRGEAPAPAFRVAGDEGELPIVSTQALLEATSGRLPQRFAGRVQAVASFRRLNAQEMEEIARAMSAERASELDVSDEIVRQLAAAAVAAADQGHELRALMSRMPAGSWALRAAPPPPARGRKKKGRS